MNPIEPLKAWNALLIASMLLLVGLLAFDRLVPPPKPTERKQAQIRSEEQLRSQTDMLYKEHDKAELIIASRVWKGSSDVVAAMALDRATKMAKANGLNLSAFRPQKPAEEGELVRLAFVMTLEGSFLNLQRYVQALETDANRLSVTLVQVASADGASDLVNATVGISAFLLKPKPEAAVKPKNEPNGTEKEIKDAKS